MKKILLNTLLILSIFSLNIKATNYYCDPENGSMSNDGLSVENAYGSLEALFANTTARNKLTAGDFIYLLSGAHGEPYITGTNTNYVTIKALSGENPKIASVLIQNATYWAFEDLTFTIDGTGGTFTKSNIFRSSTTASYIKVNNCNFYVAESSASWSKSDWDANTRDVVDIAVFFEGTNIIFNNNTIKNVYNAVFFEGQHTEIKNNLIDNFGADALRILASNSVCENNTIRDAYVEDYGVNHDDAIQMYDVTDINTGMLTNIIIRNNKIFEFADPITQAMINDNIVGYSMQGIFMTDGHPENMIIENNLVVSDQYHGITLMGAQNCRIQNNTVLKTPTPISAADILPWVQFTADKNSNESINNIIRNNLTTKLTPWTYPDAQNTTENNIEITTADYTNYFVDPDSFNFQLKESSPAIDVGINNDLTATDLAGNNRLSGTLVDVGAYEFQGGDTDAPQISQIPDTYISTQITIEFNEKIQQSDAETISNYTIDNGILVQSANLEAGDTAVTLTVSALSSGTTYTLTVNNIKDLSGNEIAPNSSETFNYLCNTVWASTFQDDANGTNPPANAFDGDMGTRWSAEGTEWIQKNFCSTQNVESVEIAFLNGDQRQYTLSIALSLNGLDYTTVYTGQSTGTTTDFETFNFTNANARYIKIKGSGNTVNNWNSYNEIRINSVINNPPVINPIDNQAITEGETLDVNIYATDADGDALTFSASNLPSFASLTDNGDGTAKITLAAQIGDAGTYADIIISVSDGTDTDTETINVTVNPVDVNEAPVLEAIGNQTLTEGETLDVNIYATDADGDALTFSASNLPSFASLTDNGDGTAILRLEPHFGDHGNYTNIKVTVSDGIDEDIEVFGIMVSQATGINTIKNKDFRIYPNPSIHGNFKINLPNSNFKKVNLRIYSVNGNLVYRQIMENNVEQLNIKSNLSPDIYFLELILDNQIYHKELIVN